ncbi:hypothetical protein N656DRAFT_772955 [Canariomyces notabilis]|uniref:Uncharacterized protein n=1 Tax=Canariomyces notabilis TaxID=2074819 RepID=A0AAN6TM38_9PEZI|nr:hypothetical protein N656DRAFT_772955 [Canariomyces arenarius]
MEEVTLPYSVQHASQTTADRYRFILLMERSRASDYRYLALCIRLPQKQVTRESNRHPGCRGIS